MGGFRSPFPEPLPSAGLKGSGNRWVSSGTVSCSQAVLRGGHKTERGTASTSANGAPMGAAVHCAVYARNTNLYKLPTAPLQTPHSPSTNSPQPLYKLPSIISNPFYKSQPQHTHTPFTSLQPCPNRPTPSPQAWHSHPITLPQSSQSPSTALPQQCPLPPRVAIPTPFVVVSTLHTSLSWKRLSAKHRRHRRGRDAAPVSRGTTIPLSRTKTIFLQWLGSAIQKFSF